MSVQGPERVHDLLRYMSAISELGLNQGAHHSATALLGQLGEGKVRMHKSFQKTAQMP